MKKFFLFFLVCLLFTTACTKKTEHENWEGDNMQDFNNEGLTVSDNGAGIYPRTPYDERYVGLAYTTWCYKGFWNTNKVWTTPLLGKYTSDDRTVIRQHAEWIADAGVDFIWIDWSNDVDYDVSIKKVINDTARPDFSMIERSTLYIFEEYSKMRQEGKVTPKISIFIGCPDPSQTSAISDGRLTRKANQVYDWFVNNPDHPEYRDLIMDYNGKPLLVVYAGTPTPWGDGLPAWDDDRFTVRWMSGFLTQQPYLLNTDTLESKYGYWSWEDRGAQTFSVSDGKPEAMIVVPSWRAEETDPPGTGERYDGLTFKEQWARARLIGVKFAMVGTWNEWVTGEQKSKEVSKDIEPNEAWGDKYLVLLKEEIKNFKGIKD